MRTVTKVNGFMPQAEECEAVEVWDVESMGLRVYGLSVRQILKLKSYYQLKTGDMDLRNL